MLTRRGYAYQPANAHGLCTSPAVVSRVAELSADRYEDERKAREIATNEAVRPWWKTDPSGQVVMSVKFGAKPLEFEKGKAGIVVPSKDKLPIVIDTLISAVRAGELDELFSQAAKTGTIGKARKAA